MLNLSIFYQDTDPNIRTFLERYLRLAHCDLFFADATVLVEGNVERLLLPQMIANAAPRLQSTYLTVLEIGGAFGYRFKALIEFLGLTALVITDLDSVFPAPLPEPGAEGQAVDHEGMAAAAIGGRALADAEDEEYDDEDEAEPAADAAEKPGKVCIAGHPGAATSNQTLLQWMPRCSTDDA